MSSEAVSDYQN